MNGRQPSASLLWAFQTRSLQAIRPNQKLLYLENPRMRTIEGVGMGVGVRTCTCTRTPDDSRINDQQMAPAMSSEERWGDLPISACHSLSLAAQWK